MKKVLSMLLAVIMLSSAFTMLASAETTTANPTTSKVLIDGVEKSFEAYNINNNNYFKLRDIAYCLSQTDKKFAIDWQADTNTAILETNKEYVAVGGELAVSSNFVSKNAIVSNTNILLNGAAVQAKAYLIDGNNYFKLRDLGTILNFSVEWDEIKQTIIVNSNTENKVVNVTNNFINKEVDDTSIHTPFNMVTNYGQVSKIQQFNHKNQGIGYAYLENSNLYIVLPDKELVVDMLYPLLGDVISDDNGYIYVVWGKENTTNNREENTIFVSKYAPDGVLIKTTGFTGETFIEDGNTLKPFWYGNCRSIIRDGIMTVYYSHKMYNGHQSSAKFQLSVNDMEIIPNQYLKFGQTPYAAHSFNLDMIWSNKFEKFIYVDQADAFDRGFQISYDTGAKYVPFHFYLQSNAAYDMHIVNKTFARLGGIVETSKGLVLVGTSARSLGPEALEENQDLFAQLLTFENGSFSNNPEENVAGGEIRTGVSSFDIYDTNDSGVETVVDYGVRWLSDVDKEGQDYTIYQPQVVQVNDKIIVFYGKGFNQGHSVLSFKYKYYYQVLSADAEVIQGETEIEYPLNSFEQPIYVNGKIQWVYAIYGKTGLGTLEIK